MTRAGPQAIRAEAIARDLNISKGSFYWHFRDVPALKTAMLKHWQLAATQAVITRLDAGESPAKERLQQLVNTATSGANTPYGGRLAEAATRDWGRYDAQVRRVVKDMDQRRVGYVAGLFCELGFTPDVAGLRARLLYGGLLGLEHLSDGQNPTLPGDLKQLLDMLLTMQPD